MFVHHRTKGMVLKKVDRGEADQLFTLYTKEFGKIEVLARAVRKICSKLRAGIETFSFSEVEFIQGRYYKILTDALPIIKFGNPGGSFKKLRFVYKISNLLDSFIKNQEYDTRVWGLLLETIGWLASDKIDPVNLEVMYYYFFWNLTAILGYRPEVFHCSICKERLKPEKIYFISRKGGMLCQQCYSGRKGGLEVKPETIKILRLILARDKETLFRVRVKKDHLESFEKLSNNYSIFIGEKGS